MSPSDRRPGSPLSYSHLRIYREIANGTTGAFMAPADVGSLLDEIERLEVGNTRLRGTLRAAGDRLDAAADRIDAIGTALGVRAWAEEARAAAE